MQLESLRYFLAITETMNFSQAAEELCISQSSLSKKIKALEIELDICLFDRTTRSIRLTEAGAALIPLAKESVLLEERVNTQMKHFRLRTREVLRIASFPVLHLYGMSEMLANYRRTHPSTTLQITEGEMWSTITALEQGQVDMAILRTNFLPDGDKYEVFPLIDEELVAICSKEHPFAQREQISLSDLQHENFVLLRAGFQEYKTGLSAMGYELELNKMNVMCQNPGAITDFVEKNLAISLMMGEMAHLLAANPQIRVIHFLEHPQFPLAIAAKRGKRSIASINFICSAVNFMKQRAEHALSAEMRR